MCMYQLTWLATPCDAHLSLTSTNVSWNWAVADFGKALVLAQICELCLDAQQSSFCIATLGAPWRHILIAASKASRKAHSEACFLLVTRVPLCCRAQHAKDALCAAILLVDGLLPKLAKAFFCAATMLVHVALTKLGKAFRRGHEHVGILIFVLRHVAELSMSRTPFVQQPCW